MHAHRQSYRWNAAMTAAMKRTCHPFLPNSTRRVSGPLSGGAAAIPLEARQEDLNGLLRPDVAGDPTHPGCCPCSLTQNTAEKPLSRLCAAPGDF